MNGIPFRNDLMKKNEIENEIFMKFFTSFFVFFIFAFYSSLKTEYTVNVGNVAK